MKKIGLLEASATRTPMARTLAAAALVACALQPATAGWVESYDKKSNKKFYYDEETRKTQWEKPDGVDIKYLDDDPTMSGGSRRRATSPQYGASGATTGVSGLRASHAPPSEELSASQTAVRWR